MCCRKRAGKNITNAVTNPTYLSYHDVPAAAAQRNAMTSSEAVYELEVAVSTAVAVTAADTTAIYAVANGDGDAGNEYSELGDVSKTTSSPAAAADDQLDHVYCEVTTDPPSDVTSPVYSNVNSEHLHWHHLDPEHVYSQLEPCGEAAYQDPVASGPEPRLPATAADSGEYQAVSE